MEIKNFDTLISPEIFKLFIIIFKGNMLFKDIQIKAQPKNQALMSARLSAMRRDKLIVRKRLVDIAKNPINNRYMQFKSTYSKEGIEKIDARKNVYYVDLDVLEMAFQDFVDKTMPNPYKFDRAHRELLKEGFLSTLKTFDWAKETKVKDVKGFFLLSILRTATQIFSQTQIKKELKSFKY